jgi:hypothetical protein
MLHEFALLAAVAFLAASYQLLAYYRENAKWK